MSRLRQATSLISPAPSRGAEMRALSRAVSDGFVCYPVMAWTPKLGALPSQAERGLNATLTP